jgi:hypothetical protein
MLTGEPAPTDPYLPPRVYDIFQKRLRPGSAVIDGQYAALSYVWGHSTALWDSRTLKTNLNQRLFNLEADEFPKTYSTAIAIASTLGFRYIWIDSLCILQDDDDDKRDNFTNHMSNIYQNAQITITSVKESANEECLASRQVATLKDAVSFVNDMIYAVPSMGNPAIDIGGESPSGPLWSNRGWTFQERLLSPRCLYFTGSQMYLECRQQLVEETGLQHFTSIYKRLDYKGKIREQLEKNWPAMVRDYSKRQLNHHTDRIPAILGIASQIHSPTVDPAVSFGFFSDRLTIDILWEADGQPLTPQELPMDSKLLPTWSWARWMGKVGWETYLETSKPCIQIAPDIHGALIAKKAKVVEIRIGAARTAPSGPDWIVWGVDHQNMFDIIFPNQQDSVKGWGTFDVDPSNDLDEKILSCILISEAADSDKGSKSKIKRCSNLLLVSYDSSVYRRRGVGQVTMDEALFDNVKESDILIL